MLILMGTCYFSADRMEEELKQLKSVEKDVKLDDMESDHWDPPQIRDNKARGTWGSKAEFFLAIMGYTVGIGSVWRFPIICSRNGGGAFLIPFFALLIIVGGPLYYLEVCLGQFTGLSAGLAFEFCPLFKGLGLLQVMLSAIVMWYSMMILAWTIYFLYSSMSQELPWTRCGNSWNTPLCIGPSSFKDDNVTTALYNSTITTSSWQNDVWQNTTHAKHGGDLHSASFEFWQNNVIGRSVGFEEPGEVQGHLVVCLFLAWLTVVLAVIKGVKTLGKVVYVTATVPYLMLTVMFIKGVTLKGAVGGMLYYVRPDFTKLAEAQVWIDAAVQVFYSLGPGWGGVITMASYNKFHQKSFWSSTMCVASSGFSSFYNGLVVFTIIGFMAEEIGTEVEVIARQSGPGLVFVAFPTAISKLPVPQFWSILFFLTLITVVFDSLFGEFETVTSCLIDMFPHHLIHRRILVNITVGSFFFVIGLPLTLNSGIYLLQLSDWYFSRFALLFGAILECFVICWMYGLEQFSQDIELMTGRRASTPLRILWAIVIPGLAFIVFVVVCVQYSPPDYGDGYVYSTLAVAMGIIGGLLPIVAMVMSGCWTLYTLPGGFLKRLRKSLRPSKAWRPNDAEVSKSYRFRQYVRPDSFVVRLKQDLFSGR